MNIRATLEVAEDGTLHLPVPPELRQGKLFVVATLEPVQADPEATEARRKQELLELLDQVRARDPFRGLEDPVTWQREMRSDVSLPFKD